MVLLLLVTRHLKALTPELLFQKTSHFPTQRNPSSVRGWSLFLCPKNLTNSQLSKMLKNFFAMWNLMSFSMIKRTTSDKDIFQRLQTQNSKWTPPPPQEGQFASLDIFINKCHHDSHKLNFNHNTKFPNLSSEERTALEKLSKRRDIIIVKVANKSSPLVVWQPNVYPNKACSSFLTLLFMLKSIKISLPLTNKLSRALLTTL